MALSEILSKIKEVKSFADEKVEEAPRETYAGRIGRNARAVESMKELRQAYAVELFRTAAFIVVVGNQRDEFVRTAIESKCFKADPEKFYSDIADRVPQVLYLGKESVANTFDILGRHLEDKMNELNVIREYNQLVFRQEYQRAINSRKDFLDLVKEAVVTQIGGEIAGIHSAVSLADEAIERNHAAKFTPILLPSGDQTFALAIARDLERLRSSTNPRALKPLAVFVVTAGETARLVKTGFDPIAVPEVSETNVKKVLKNISSKLKSNR
jgi:hypothetical protein